MQTIISFNVVGEVNITGQPDDTSITLVIKEFLEEKFGAEKVDIKHMDENDYDISEEALSGLELEEEEEGEG